MTSPALAAYYFVIRTGIEPVEVELKIRPPHQEKADQERPVGDSNPSVRIENPATCPRSRTGRESRLGDSNPATRLTRAR